MKKLAAFKAFAAASVLVFGSMSVSFAGTIYVPKPPKGSPNGTRSAVTIQAAIDDPGTLDGDVIVVASGTHAGATIDKPVTIKGTLNRGKPGTTIGVSRTRPNPVVGSLIAGFLLVPGGDGATIQDLKFSRVDLPVYAVGVDNVVVQHTEMAKPVQGITNWDGSNWTIANNNIKQLQTKGGGGLGIVIGGRFGSASSNTVSSNTISGNLTISKTDLGQFIGAGIALVADPDGRTPEVTLTAGDLNTIDLNKKPAETKEGVPLLCGIMLNELGVTGVPNCMITDNVFSNTNFGKTKYQKLEKPDGLENCPNTLAAAAGPDNLKENEEAPVVFNVLSVRPL